MLNLIKAYTADERAMDGSVEKVILITVSISVAFAIGWWIWNNLSKKTAQGSCTANPNNPFCVE